MDDIVEKKYQSWIEEKKIEFEKGISEKNEFLIDAYLKYLKNNYETKVLELLKDNQKNTIFNIKEIEEKCKKICFLTDDEKMELLFHDENLIKMLKLYNLILRKSDKDKETIDSHKVLEEMSKIEKSVQNSNKKIANQILLKTKNIIDKNNILLLTQSDIKYIKMEYFDEKKLYSHNLITNNNLNSKFFKIYVQYKLYFERYLLNTLPIKKVDELFDKYNLDREYYNMFNRKTTLGVLKNIYLANIFHIERLTEKQMSVFESGNDITKLEVVIETYKEVIKKTLEEDNDTIYFHIVPSMETKRENLSIVFEILSYSEKVINIEKDLTSFSKLLNEIEKIEKDCYKILGVPIYFIEYKKFYNEI